MHIKKQKGDVGLVVSIAEFTKNEFHVSLPIAEDLKYDFIVEKNEILCRVQARYTSKKNGAVSINLKSVWSNKKGNHIKKRQSGDFDILSCYCPDTQKCYFMSDCEFDNGTAITLKIDNSSVNNLSIRDAKKYESCDRAFENWIKLRGEAEDESIKRQVMDINDILKLKKEKTWQEIGSLYGVSGVTVSSYLKSKGVDTSVLGIRRNELSKFDCNSEKAIRIKEELLQNKSMRQIAKDTGYTRYEITYIVNNLKNNGVVAELVKAPNC